METLQEWNGTFSLGARGILGPDRALQEALRDAGIPFKVFESF